MHGVSVMLNHQERETRVPLRPLATAIESADKRRSGIWSALRSWGPLEDPLRFQVTGKCALNRPVSPLRAQIRIIVKGILSLFAVTEP